MAILALDPRDGKPWRFLERLTRREHRWLFWVLYGFNGLMMFFLAAYPFTVDSHIYLQRTIYQDHRDSFTFYKTDFDPYYRWGLRYSFYQPEALKAITLNNVGELGQIVTRQGKPVYFVSALPMAPLSTYGLAARVERLDVDCSLPCLDQEVEWALAPLMKAFHDLSPENLNWGAIYRISPLDGAQESGVSQSVPPGDDALALEGSPDNNYRNQAEDHRVVEAQSVRKGRGGH
jgi:hypothetical protein